MNKSAKKHLIIAAINIFFSLLLLAFIFPGYFFTYATGLDASWQYGINAAFAKDLIFGKDVLFSYGPLGFLCCSMDIGNNLVLAWMFKFGVHVLLGVILIYLSLKKKFPYAVPSFAVCYIMSMYTGLTYEYQLQLVLILFLCIAVETERASKKVSGTFT